MANNKLARTTNPTVAAKTSSTRFAALCRRPGRERNCGGSAKGSSRATTPRLSIDVSLRAPSVGCGVTQCIGEHVMQHDVRRLHPSVVVALHYHRHVHHWACPTAILTQ